ncbi:MAG: hypothetical protein M9896_19725 [Candidatus Promineofilum sp.]|uniref:hypothetical protein n=1 Tax=Promineifilum sp. TaxID=2664178 RepID=UPI002411E053|nr:hypothetical protein [Promineifilum sp.]
MNDSYETTAVFSDEKTLVLDKRLPITGGRVKVIVEPLIQGELPPTSDFLLRLQAIHKTLFESGFIPPTRAQIDAELEQLRNEWDS